LNRGKFLVKSWLTVVGLLVAQICLADSSTTPSWSKGPVRLPLGECGQIDVPAGFKFADAQNARLYLQKTKNTADEGRLLGLLMPLSGDWYVALEYFDTGHINDALEGQLNADAIFSTLQPRINELNRTRESRGQPPMANVTWDTKPIYHPDSHTLEWALRGEGISGDAVLDYTFRMLGRQGILQGRATLLRVGVAGSEMLRDLLSAVSFKPGERYADFKPGDKSASMNLGGVASAKLSGPGGAKEIANPESAGGLSVFWISLAVLGCAGIVGGGVFAKKLRGKRAFTHHSHPDAGAASIKNGGLKLNGIKQFKLPGREKASRNGVNGNGRSQNGQGKRKRMFNYHKFYTEMVLQGPAPVIADSYNGYELEQRYGNQHGNGNGHTHGNGHSNGNGQSNGNGHNGMTEGQPSAGAVLQAHSELIAIQKSLIEEQKRLIQEQARLIEEKSRLIAEKGQLLDTQSQMLDKNLI